MNDLLHNLIEALREELKQYGEMLAVLDQQQHSVVQRQVDNLLQNVAAINAHAEAITAVSAMSPVSSASRKPPLSPSSSRSSPRITVRWSSRSCRKTMNSSSASIIAPARITCCSATLSN
jgi:hypothetical protein